MSDDNCLHCHIIRSIDAHYKGSNANVQDVLESLNMVAAEIIAGLPEEEMRKNTVSSMAEQLEEMVQMARENGFYHQLRQIRPEDHH